VIGATLLELTTTFVLAHPAHHITTMIAHKTTSFDI
jgi:hypothetical protein